MTDPRRKLWIRIGLVARQNRAALGFIALWLTASVAVFRFALHLPWHHAALAAATLVPAPGPWGHVHESFTQLVVFGVVASMVFSNATRKYRPESTGRALAEEARDHVVVIGYTNLGARVHALVEAAGKTVVVVEEDRAKVAHLIEDERPLVLAKGERASDLRAASVARAKVVVVASDDMETVAIAARLVRAESPDCPLILRCPDDDAGEVLAKAYRAKVISTSKMIAKHLLAFQKKHRLPRAVVFGENSVGRRVAQTLACPLLPATEDREALARANLSEIDLVVIADDDLGKNLVRVDRIRDITTRARIVCRAFHDEAAEVLTKAPLSCVVFSTSRHAAETLVQDGAFRVADVEAVPARPAVAPVV